MDWVLPRTLSHFEIVERIGAGGMGVVYRARDLKLDRTVAVKVLSDEFLGDGEFHERFLREARTASALNHPNIVTIHEIDADDGLEFIVMEYVEGRRLDEIMDGSGLPIVTALDLGIQIAAGLVAAQKQGIVHRDLKPSNIIVTEDAGAKILDFGLAKRVWSAEPLGPAEVTPTVGAPITRAGVVQGTPQYMSPEQASGKAVDMRSDVFSFGCILYEMLCGIRPFNGDTTLQLLASILSDDPVPLDRRVPGIHPEITRIVEKAMQKNAGDRYQWTSQLHADLQALRQELSGRTSLTTTPVAIESKPSRRLLLAVAALLIAVASSITGWLLLKKEEPSPRAETLHRIEGLPGSVREGSLSPDGSMVAFVAEDAAGTSQIWVKSLAQGNPVQVTTGDAAATGPSWSPRNDQILFELEQSGIWSVPPLGGQPRRILEAGLDPSFDSEGRRIVFEHQGLLWIADADGSHRRQVEGVRRSYFSSMVHREPSFSPDGRFIAYFESEDGPAGDIWIVPSEGGTPRRLTNDRSFGGEPVWTPDGRWIVYASNRAGAMNLWCVSPEGGPPRPVTTGAGEDRNPDISRDGTKLVYRNTRVLYAIAVLDPSTGKRETLVERHSPTGIPSISPSGDRIAFFGQTENGTQLFTQPIDGGEISQVTSRSDEDNIVPFWSADGRSLYYYQQAPTHSFRRIASIGGESTLVLPDWSWVTHNNTRIDARGERAVYSRLEGGRVQETLVRDIGSGAEIALEKALYFPAWSPDQRTIVGYDQESQIFACDVVSRNCRYLAKGVRPEWSSDGRQIFFLRTTARSNEVELWVANMDGTEERRLATLDSIQVLVFGYGITADGRVVWSQYKPGQSEFWWAKLK